MSRWSKSKILWLSLGSALSLGVWVAREPATSQAQNLGVVTKKDLVQRVTIAGSVIPIHRTLISAPYSAYVKKLYVQIGDHVRAGDPIVSLTQSLNSSRDDTYPIRAPFDGTVVQVLKMEGEYVDQQNTNGNGIGIVRIDDLRHLFIDASSPEYEVRKLKLGQEAVIKATSIQSRTYHGKIAHISLAAKEQKDWDKSRVEFSVLIDVDDPDGQLEPGMSVVCDIVTKRLPNVLTVRHEYLQKSGDHFYVVTEAGRKKEVRVGEQNEEEFEVKSGVTEGEKLRLTDFLSLSRQSPN